MVVLHMSEAPTAYADGILSYAAVVLRADFLVGVPIVPRRERTIPRLVMGERRVTLWRDRNKLAQCLHGVCITQPCAECENEGDKRCKFDGCLKLFVPKDHREKYHTKHCQHAAEHQRHLARDNRCLDVDHDPGVFNSGEG